METPLHAQKVAILSRLIKESSLTFEEALFLLKEEEQEKPVEKTTVINSPSYWTSTPGITGSGTYSITVPLATAGTTSDTFATLANFND